MSPVADAPEDKCYSLGYGAGEVGLCLSRYSRVASVLPAPGPDENTDSMLGRALAAPIGGPGLESLASRARNVVILIPDATRPAVAGRVLPSVLEIVRRARSRPADVAVFIAAGVHSPVSDSAARCLAGQEIPAEIKVSQNDSRLTSDFAAVGKTRRGTPVMINRRVLGADLRIVIGSVGFHYFAGMSGGRKMIVPGAATAETVRANHRLSLTEEGAIHPRCRSGVLDGNPVHEDMVEGMTLLGGVFLINVILDGRGGVAGYTCGDPVASHLAACRQAAGLLRVPLERSCDLAVASAGGQPFDADLIQTHKSIDHAAESVRDGGVVIALAECARGVGSETFLPWFDLGTPAEVARKLRTDYQLNGQTALSLMLKLERLRIILVSTLDPGVVRRAGMISAPGLDEALAVAEEYVGKDPVTYVIPNAWGILPAVEVQ